MNAHVRQRPPLPVLLIMALLLGCGSDKSATGPSAPLTPTSIALSATSLSFDAVGATQQVSATVKDQAGHSLPNVTVSWTSSDPGVATASGGTITAMGNGSATVTISAGSISASVAVVVRQAVAQIAVDPDTLSLLVDAKVRVRVSLLDRLGHSVRSTGAGVAWSLSSPSIARVVAADSTALVSASAAGYATLTVTSGSATASVPVSVAAPVQLVTQAKEVTGRVSLPSGVDASAVYVLNPALGASPVGADGSFHAPVASDAMSTLVVMNGAEPLSLILSTPAEGTASGVLFASGSATRSSSDLQVDAHSSAVAYAMLTPLFAAAPQGVQGQLVALLDGLPEMATLEAVIRQHQESEGRLPGADDADFIAALHTLVRAAYDKLAADAGVGSADELVIASVQGQVQENGVRLLLGSDDTVEVQNTRSRDVDLYLVPADDHGAPVQGDFADLGGWAGAAKDRAMILRPANYIPDVTSLSVWIKIVTGHFDYGPTNPAPLHIPFDRTTPRFLIYAYGASWPWDVTKFKGDETWRWVRPEARTIGLSVVMPIIDALISVKLAALKLDGSDIVALEDTWEFFGSMFSGINCAAHAPPGTMDTAALECILSHFADALATKGAGALFTKVVAPLAKKAGKPAIADAAAQFIPAVKLVHAALKAASVVATGVAIGISDPLQTFDLSYNQLLGASTLKMQSGDGQSGATGQTLARPLIVKVTDQSGAPVSSAWVDWKASAGGLLSDSSTVTGTDGTSSVTWTLGPSSGSQSIQVELAGMDTTRFTFTATADSGTAVASGIWKGTGTQVDPATGGRSRSYSLTVDFNAMAAAKDACHNRGAIQTVSATQVVINWPDCGIETVAYTIRSPELDASGQVVAFSDGRKIPTTWKLTKQ